MSYINVTVRILLPIKILSYSPGSRGTYLDPPDPPEAEWEIDAPKEVQEWLDVHLDLDGEIEDAIMDWAEEGPDSED